MINKIESISTNILLKLRCYKRKHKLVNQFCKNCGREMGYDFSVPDTDWEKVPQKFQNHILCVHCFCGLYKGDLSKVKIKFYK